MTDPWENIKSTSTDALKTVTVSYLKDICNFYNIQQKYCMVLGDISHCHIICSHIWPSCTYGRGLEAFDLQEDDVNNPRNFLRLHRDIEHAFDHKRLYFVYHSGPSPLILRVVILDPSLHQEEIRFKPGSPYPTKTFSEIHERLFSYEFVDDRKPFLRLLSLHAHHAIAKARHLNWITDSNDIVSKNARNVELARLSLEPNYSAVMRAFFDKP
jgi:hypothetical protein